VLVDERDLWPGGQYVTTHLIVSTKFLDERPDVVLRLLKGQVAANDFVHEQPTVAQRIVSQAISKYTSAPADLALVASTWKNLEFTNDPIATSLAKSAKDAESVGLLQPVKLNGIYDLKLLNKALKQAGEPPVSASLKAKAAQ
jgi:NitT/TauT family transport system substrate-binding protein